MEYSGKDKETKNGDYWHKFLDQIFDLILNEFSPDSQSSAPVLRFEQPERLREILDVELRENGTSLETVMDLIRGVVKYSVKTGNPFFFNQLYHGTDEYGLAAGFILEALNTNLHTFDAAPVLTVIEKEVIHQLCCLCGFDDGDGIFCPGGSIASMFGVSLARYRHNPLTKEEGLYGSIPLLIFASKQSHYSVTKSAFFMGMGRKSVVSVECNRNGSMNIGDLENKIYLSTRDVEVKPFLIWCTAGTTVLGAYDHLTEIARIAEKYKLWMHVDGCLGASALISKKWRHLLNGIERADSVVWNWHKMLGAPLQTSAFLTPHKGLLLKAHGLQAEYLFQNSKHYDPAFDIGDSSVQCGRKADSLKVWLMWKARGLRGLESLIDAAFENARLLAEKLQESPYFKLVLPEIQGATICFWIIPKYLQNMPENEYFWNELKKVTPTLKLKMVESGFTMITYQELKDKELVYFFRVTMTAQPPLTENDLNDLVKNLIHLCDQLESV